MNGLLYGLRTSAPITLFDVVSGNNGYDPRVRALSAAPGYDLASGLGVPRFDQLATALPPPAPSRRRRGARSGSARAAYPRAGAKVRA